MPRQAKTTRRKRWAYSAGARGVNRVRAFAHAKTGALYLEWKAPDAQGIIRTMREPLVGFSQDEARAAADRKAVALREDAPQPDAGPLTLGALFDIYLREADPGRSTRKHNERATALFYACWGRDRLAHTLAPADVEQYTRARRLGQLQRARDDGTKVPGRPVRDRVLEEDLTYLRTVIRWATRKRKDATGRWLLASDPLGEFTIPREKDPRRPMLDAGEYEMMCAKAFEMNRLVWLALVLCHETGRRLNSVRQLRWNDVDLAGRVIHWQGEKQKNGQTSVTPMTDALALALKQARIGAATVGDGWLFPSSRSQGPIDRKVFYNGWGDIRRACKLPLVGVAYHSQRRQLASDLATAPLAMVASLGGWKHPEVAVKVYQQPSIEQQRAVLTDRERYRRGA